MDEHPAPITDQEAHERLMMVADELASASNLCESVPAATAMKSAAQAIYIITAGLLAAAVKRKG